MTSKLTFIEKIGRFDFEMDFNQNQLLYSLP